MESVIAAGTSMLLPGMKSAALSSTPPETETETETSALDSHKRKRECQGKRPPPIEVRIPEEGSLRHHIVSNSRKRLYLHPLCWNIETLALLGCDLEEVRQLPGQDASGEDIQAFEGSKRYYLALDFFFETKFVCFPRYTRSSQGVPLFFQHLIALANPATEYTIVRQE